MNKIFIIFFVVSFYLYTFAIEKQHRSSKKQLICLSFFIFNEFLVIMVMYKNFQDQKAQTFDTKKISVSKVVSF